MENITEATKKFMRHASAEEKKIFLMILCALANIDGKLQKEEVAYIEEIATEMDAELKPAYFNCTPGMCMDGISTIKNRRLALELLKYMLTLAYTDNEFSDSEGHFICDVAETLNIEPEKVGEISSWIIDRIIWLEQAAVIFEDN